MPKSMDDEEDNRQYSDGSGRQASRRRHHHRHPPPPPLPYDGSEMQATVPLMTERMNCAASLVADDDFDYDDDV